VIDLPRAYDHPVAEFLRHLQRQGIAGIHVHVEQPGQKFVLAIPDDMPSGGILFKVVEIALGLRGEVAIRLLELGQLRHQRVGLRLELRIAGRADHQRAGGEIVSRVMPARSGMGACSSLVACKFRNAGLDAEVLAVIPQEPIGIERQQILVIQSPDLQ